MRLSVSRNGKNTKKTLPRSQAEQMQSRNT